MSTETEFSLTSPMQLPRRKWPAAALLFVLSFLILFFASLQYFWPGTWWESHEALGWKGGELVLMKGQGSSSQGRLTIDGVAESGVAVASLSPPAFSAADYPVVRWSISGAKPGARLEFVWRTAADPSRAFVRQVEWMGNEVAPLHMAGDTHWRGKVTGLVLMVRAPLDAPLVIEAVNLEPFAPLRTVVREWFGAEQWLGTSINFVGGNSVRQWLAPLPFVAAALGLAILGYGLLVWRKALAHNIPMLWALVFIAWFVLDMRWQLDLWQKLGMTQQRYSGKSWEGKHLAAEDGRLFDLMQQVRSKMQPAQARVFLFADEDYLRGRGAYHLYPFNVFASPDLQDAGQYKSGDFILILGKDEVEYDPAQQLLKWGAGQRLGADLSLLAENNVLLRVR